MGHNRNLSAYPDVTAFFSRALDSARGAQIHFETEGKAKNFRLRCYAARKADLTQNNRLHAEAPEAMPPNFSVWNALMLSIVPAPQGGYYVRAVTGEQEMHKIEEI